MLSGLRDSVFSKLDELTLEQICSILGRINRHKLPYGITPEELLSLKSYIIGLTEKAKSSGNKANLQVISLNLTPSILRYLIPRTKDLAYFEKSPASISKTISSCVYLLKHLSQVAEAEDSQPVVSIQQPPQEMSVQTAKAMRTISTATLNNSLKLLWCLVDDYAPGQVFDECIEGLFELIGPQVEHFGRYETFIFIKCILAWECRAHSTTQSNTILQKLVTSTKLSGTPSGMKEYYAYAKLLELTNRPTGEFATFASVGKQDQLPSLTRVNLAEERVIQVLKEFVRVPVSSGNKFPPELPEITVDIMLPGVKPPTIVEVNGIHHYTSAHFRKSSTDPVLVVDAASFNQQSERMTDFRGRELVRLRALALAGYRVVCVDMIAIGRGPAADLRLGQLLAEVISGPPENASKAK